MFVAVPLEAAPVAVRVATVPVRVQYGNHLRITRNDRCIIIIIFIVVEQTRSYNIIIDSFFYYCQTS